MSRSNASRDSVAVTTSPRGSLALVGANDSTTALGVATGAGAGVPEEAATLAGASLVGHGAVVTALGIATADAIGIVAANGFGGGAGATARTLGLSTMALAGMPGITEAEAALAAALAGGREGFAAAGGGGGTEATFALAAIAAAGAGGGAEANFVALAAIATGGGVDFGTARATSGATGGTLRAAASFGGGTTTGGVTACGVTLQYLDLRWNQLGEGLDELVSSVSATTTLREFYIQQSNGRLPYSVVQELRNALQGKPSLTTDLGKLFSVEDVHSFIGQLEPGAISVDLSGRMLYPTKEMMQALLGGLPQSIHTLALARNRIECNFNDNAVTQVIGESIGRLRLRRLDISHNCMGLHGGTSFFAQALVSLSSTLEELEVSNNYLGRSDVSYDTSNIRFLTDSLLHLNLTTFNFAYNGLSENAEEFQIEGETELIRQFLVALGSQTRMRSLFLGKADAIVYSPGTESIASTEERDYVANANRFGANETWVQALTQSLKQMPFLEEVDLSMNRLGDDFPEESAQLIDILGTRVFLRKLYLGTNDWILSFIGDSADLGSSPLLMSATTNMLRSLRNLQQVNLANTNIGILGTEQTGQLVDVLAQLPLSTINVQGMTNLTWTPITQKLAILNTNRLTTRCQDQVCHGGELPDTSADARGTQVASVSYLETSPAPLLFGEQAVSFAASAVRYAAAGIASSVSYLGSDTSLPAPKAQTYLPYSGTGYGEESLFSVGSSYTSFTPAKIIIMGVVAIALVYFLMKVLKKFTRSWTTDRPLPSV